MSFGAAVSTCFSKYATFSGRARRSEYWWFVLLYSVVYVVGVVITAVTANTSVSALGPIVLVVGILALVLPLIAVAIRRLHDTGRSGWWYLLGLVPLIGAIVLLVFYVEDSHPANQHGPSPKQLGAHTPYPTPYG